MIAFVAAAPGARRVDAPLAAHCLRHIARFGRPRRYAFVESLPRNHYGKPLKAELRERLRTPG